MAEAPTEPPRDDRRTRLVPPLLILVIVAVFAALVLIDRLAIVVPDVALTIIKLVGTFATIGAGVVAIFSNNLIRGTKLQPLGYLLVAVIVIGAGATYEADRLKDRSGAAQANDLLFVGSLAALPFQNVQFSDVELTVNTADPIFSELLKRIRAWNNLPDANRDVNPFAPVGTGTCFSPTSQSDASVDDTTVFGTSAWSFHENSAVMRAPGIQNPVMSRIFPWALDAGTKAILRPKVSVEIYSAPQSISSLRVVPKNRPADILYWTDITHEKNIGNFTLSCTTEATPRCRDVLFADHGCAGYPSGAIRVYGVPDLIDRQLVIRVAPDSAPDVRVQPGVVPFHLHGISIDVDHRTYDIDLQNATEYADTSGGVFVVYAVRGPLKQLLLTSCSSENTYCDFKTRTEPEYAADFK